MTLSWHGNTIHCISRGAGTRKSIMLKPDVLTILCCPEDHSTLTLVGRSLIDEINEAVRQGHLRNRAGQIVERAVDGGLMRSKHDLLYPIIDGIPVLVRDEAIPLDQLERKSSNVRNAPPRQQ